jgi:hypothetical protein
LNGGGAAADPPPPELKVRKRTAGGSSHAMLNYRVYFLLTVCVVSTHLYPSWVGCKI